MLLPRTLVTRHPMGRTMGAPFDTERHSEVLRSAFGLLETAEQPGSLVELEEAYRLPAGQS